jgi:hypothetical protein
MDLKAFGLGAMCGIAASALVFLVVVDDRDERMTAGSSQETAIAAGVREEEARNRREGRKAEEHKAGADPRMSARSDEPQLAEAAPARTIQGEPEHAPHRSAATQGSSGDAVQSADSDETVAESDSSSWPPPRAARAKEAKDAGWSHYMEQTLSRYLATHPKAAQFDFRNIDCRSTFCEIQATGVDESTKPVWSQVTYDLQQQPWSEFDMAMSEEYRTQDGRPQYTTTFHRKAPRR